jgi:hypothetical protein
MSRNNEEKNHPKKKDVESKPRKPFVKPLDLLEKAGYRMVNGPYVPAQGDQN